MIHVHIPDSHLILNSNLSRSTGVKLLVVGVSCGYMFVEEFSAQRDEEGRKLGWLQNFPAAKSSQIFLLVEFDEDHSHMSSAPSASALSAVLRCRRNIWSRNSPSPPPLSAAHSAGAARAPAASAWGAVSRRERARTEGVITVVFQSLQAGFRAPRSDRASELKLRQVEARRAASAAPDALKLARTRTYGRISTFSGLNPLSALVLKLSARSSRVMKAVGEQPFSAAPGGSPPRGARLSFTLLLSERRSVRVSVALRDSSFRSLNAAPRLHSQQAENSKNASLKVSRRLQSPLRLYNSKCWGIIFCFLSFFLSFFRNILLASSQTRRTSRVVD